MAHTILHKADTRGKADYGWLKSSHTFSFGQHYDPARIQFGALRVLNDDWVNGGQGFGEHPHDNMEIISIPLEGALQHEDSMGNVAVITSGEIQVMSAGTGIYHQEFNKNKNEPVKFLQIWLFPNQRNVEPRYQQQRYDDRLVPNQFTQILSPSPDDDGVWIYQNAWFNIGKLEKGTKIDYQFKNNNNGLYVFVLKGDVKVNSQILNERDGLGLSETDLAAIEMLTDAEILLMEVPMNY
ncbi:pirin family protein [Pedobacter sp. GR22-6]|uniref:pirin family protein n=1 Tax=Pedobacter sp. GR22-6 TaxID=3127957 RepID=UPI00307EB465